MIGSGILVVHAEIAHTHKLECRCIDTGAVLLPVGSITKDTAAAVIPNLDSTVLVYCRSGNRSKTASAALVELGYINVYEFGGINTWPYEVE